MKIKSQTFTQASGSLAGLTASRNRGGMYLRARATVVNPASAPQQSARARLAQLSTAWQTDLTDAQRTAWATYAANVSRVDTLGNNINLTAANWYIACNAPRLQAGLSRVDDGPTVFNTGSYHAPTYTASVTTGHLVIAFDNADEWAVTDAGALLFYQSRPMAPTINYFKGPFLYSGDVLGNTTTPPTSPHNQNFLQPPVAGNIIMIRTQATAADGRLTSDTVTRVPIVA